MDEQNPDSGVFIGSSVLPLGNEVIIDAEEKLTSSEVDKIREFCVIAQGLSVTRFLSQARYDFTKSRCATPDGKPVTERVALTISTAIGGQQIWMRSDHGPIESFFSTNVSSTSGPLAFYCPDMLRGRETEFNRYQFVDNQLAYASYVAVGVDCGSGVASGTTCFLAQKLVTTGGQKWIVSSQTMSTFVTGSQSFKYQGLQHNRNYLAVAPQCNPGEFIKVDAQLYIPPSDNQ